MVYSISGIVILGIMIASTILLWKICRWILIPLQITLFLGLLFVGCKFIMEYDGNSKSLRYVQNEFNRLKDQIVDDVVGEVVEKTSEKVRSAIP